MPRAPRRIVGTPFLAALALATAVGATGCAAPPEERAVLPDADDQRTPRMWFDRDDGDPRTRESSRQIRSEMMGLEREAMRDMGELGFRGPGVRGQSGDAEARRGVTTDVMEMQREIRREQQEVLGTFPEIFAPGDWRESYRRW